MQHVVAAVLRALYKAVEDECLVFGIVFAMDFHAIEYPMVLVLDVGCQYHFAITGDFEVYILCGVVDKGEAANLG